MKAIDDGKGEDVTNGEGVNVKDLGDGEADIGDDDGDNNDGDFFLLLFKGIMFPSLSELCIVSIFLLLYS